MNGYKERLLSNGDYISDQVGTYQPQDLAALTTETGVEYTLITIGGESHLIRGGERYTGISNELYRKLLDGQGTLDCHSHPFIGDLVPSKEDRWFLGKLTWQKDSIIIDPTQRAARYTEYGVYETFDLNTPRDENYYDDMFEEKE